jgi:hypothetical protein
MRMTHTLMTYLYEVLRTPPTTKQNDALAHALHSSNRRRKNAVFRPKVGWVCVQGVLMNCDECVEFGKLFGAQ